MNKPKTILESIFTWAFTLVVLAMLLTILGYFAWMFAGGVWHAFSALTAERIFKVISGSIVCSFFAFMLLMLYEAQRGEHGENKNAALYFGVTMATIVSALGILLVCRG